jgi:hypothetical protein
VEFLDLELVGPFFQRRRAVVVDLDRLVAGVFFVEADLERVVVLDDAIEVLLGVEIDLFLPLFVF